MNEHTSLYRKYRPTDWEEVLGQDHIVEALRGAVAQGNVGHAYLFSGSRGTGKTSLARILARAVGTTERDLYEIDAASNRGVDDIRALREEVHTLPFASPRKTYLIDEAHMLTKEAWNALLKTLEEPPAHVVFIFATTELDKVPETIQSRCQTFQFRKPSTVLLKDMVARVAAKEGYELEPAAADLIALLADSSYRDAHGMLQKVLASSNTTTITASAVETVAGAPKAQLVLALIDTLAAGDLAGALGEVRKAAHHNIDAKLFLTLVLRIVRAVLLLRSAPALRDELRAEFTDEEYAAIERHASARDPRIHSKLLLALLDAYDRVGATYVPFLPLELALVDHLSPLAQAERNPRSTPSGAAS